MTQINDILNRQTLRLLNFSPATPKNLSLILPEPPTRGVSSPAMQATVQRLFEARYKGSISEVTSSAHNLHAAANSLSPSSPAFTKRTASTSDAGVAEIKVQEGSGLGSVDIDVQQLATTQTNRGTALDKSSSGSFDSGRQFFDLNVGQNSTRLSVYVGPNDTNETTLKAMAKSINNADMNVTAKVETSADTNKVQLRIESTQTGTETSFSLQDTLGSVVQNSGVNTVEAAAQNAIFKVNEAGLETQSNSFAVDSGKVQVSLKGKTGSATLTATQDVDALVSAVKDFVAKTNQFRQSLSKASKTLNTNVASAFDNQISLIRESLGEIGVSVNMGVVLSDLSPNENALSVNDDSLRQAIEGEPTRVEELLAGPGGLSSRLGSIAEAVESSSALHLMARPEQALSFINLGVGRDAVTGVLLNALA